MSYTKTLEARVAELEATLANLQGGSGNRDIALEQQNSQQQQNHVEGSRRSLSRAAGSRDSRSVGADEDVPSDLATGIDGLKVGDDGRISLYGPTSLFQLPSGLARETSDLLLPAASELDGRKERLINNAWRERAFEQLTTIPVRGRGLSCFFFEYFFFYMATGRYTELHFLHFLCFFGSGPVSIPARFTLVLDTPAFQLRLSAGIYSSVGTLGKILSFISLIFLF